MQGMEKGSGFTQGKGKDACRDWRNHLKRMMDEIKKVQDQPKVRERKLAGTGGTTSRE